VINPLADLFLPGADRASTPMELARLFAHRSGFKHGLVVGACNGALIAVVALAAMGVIR
jgi:hypothetical protein